jgi:MFS family permease
LVWPAALYEQLVEREPASSWYRLQIRQAVRFGVRSAAIGLAALLWPLIASLLVGNLTLTIVFYIVAIALDCMLFVIWLRHAIRYSKRAARGETFDLEPIAATATRKLATKQ